MDVVVVAVMVEVKIECRTDLCYWDGCGRGLGGSWVIDVIRSVHATG